MDKLDYKIRVIQQSDLELILRWRNHPKIRRHMYSQHLITWDEHLRWFLKKKKDPKTHLLMFELDKNPEGFISFRENECVGTAEWGFYLSPDAPKNTGRLLGFAGLSYAFETICVHKVCGEALGYNEKSIRLHLSLGFQQEGVLRQHHFDGKTYYDVIRFGLLVDRWDEKDLKGGEGESSEY